MSLTPPLSPLPFLTSLTPPLFHFLSPSFLLPPHHLHPLLPLLTSFLLTSYIHSSLLPPPSSPPHLLTSFLLPPPSLPPTSTPPFLPDLSSSPFSSLRPHSLPPPLSSHFSSPRFPLLTFSSLPFPFSPSSLHFNHSLPPDVDECALRIHNCVRRSRCINTIGSYTCVCPGNISCYGKTSMADSLMRILI